jgi:hypothetical protein
MRLKHVSNVSSSTPAARRASRDALFIEPDSAAEALDIVGLEGAVVGLDMAPAPPLLIEELVSDDSILPSLAQPPTISAKRMTNSAFFSMGNLQ